MCYERGDYHMVVEKKPAEWQKMKQEVTAMLLAGTATISLVASRNRYFNTGGNLQLQSTQTGSWRGKEVKLFIFGMKPLGDKDEAPAIRKKIYVDDATDRVIATQEFALFRNADPLLVDQLEVDYSTPDPTLFDPIKFEENTTRVPKSEPYVRP